MLLGFCVASLFVAPQMSLCLVCTTLSSLCLILPAPTATMLQKKNETVHPSRPVVTIPTFSLLLLSSFSSSGAFWYGRSPPLLALVPRTTNYWYSMQGGV